MKKFAYYYDKCDFKLIYGDSLEVLKSIKPESIDMIFADPPYFLSDNGITCSGGKMVSVNKGEWDKAIDFKEKHKFNKEWIKLCKRVLKSNGTIWISGTMHNIYSIGMALEENGFTDGSSAVSPPHPARPRRAKGTSFRLLTGLPSDISQLFLLPFYASRCIRLSATAIAFTIIDAASAAAIKIRFSRPSSTATAASSAENVRCNAVCVRSAE